MKLNKIIILSLLPLFCFVCSCSQPNALRARAGEQFTLTLESTPTTGYSWQLAEPLNERIVQLVGSDYTPARTDRVGAGGAETWTFLAVNKGSAKIALKYARPWEKDKPPVEEKSFLVKVR